MAILLRQLRQRLELAFSVDSKTGIKTTSNNKSSVKPLINIKRFLQSRRPSKGIADVRLVLNHPWHTVSLRPTRTGSVVHVQRRKFTSTTHASQRQRAYEALHQTLITYPVNCADNLFDYTNFVKAQKIDKKSAGTAWNITSVPLTTLITPYPSAYDDELCHNYKAPEKIPTDDEDEITTKYVPDPNELDHPDHEDPYNPVRSE